MNPARGARALPLIPGLALSAAVALAAVAVQALELRLFGRGWIDAIVLAILIGAAIRSVWTPPASLRPGVEFSARTLLEIAVVLMLTYIASLFFTLRTHKHLYMGDAGEGEPEGAYEDHAPLGRSIGMLVLGLTTSPGQQIPVEYIAVYCLFSLFTLAAVLAIVKRR